MYYQKYLKNNQNFQNKRFQSTTQPILQRTPQNNKSQLNIKYGDTYNVNNIINNNNIMNNGNNLQRKS